MTVQKLNTCIMTKFKSLNTISRQELDSNVWSQLQNRYDSLRVCVSNFMMIGVEGKQLCAGNYFH